MVRFRRRDCSSSSLEVLGAMKGWVCLSDEHEGECVRDVCVYVACCEKVVMWEEGRMERRMISREEGISRIG